MNKHNDLELSGMKCNIWS